MKRNHEWYWRQIEANLIDSIFCVSKSRRHLTISNTIKHRHVSQNCVNEVHLAAEKPSQIHFVYKILRDMLVFRGVRERSTLFGFTDTEN